jgi:biotin synthase
VAGANSIFIGDILLTTRNPRTSHDASLLGRLGIASKLGDAAPSEVQVTTEVAAQIAI